MLNLTEPLKLIKGLFVTVILAIIGLGVYFAATPLIAASWVIGLLVFLILALAFSTRVNKRWSEPNGSRRRRKRRSRRGDEK